MNKVVLITGASRGIGAATARLAAERGYAACVNYQQNVAAAETVVREIKAAGGIANEIRADVSVESEVVQMFQQIDKTFGSLTALVNCAGLVEKQTRIEEINAARLHRTFSTNVTGSFLCAREAIHRMSTKRGGIGGAIERSSSVKSVNPMTPREDPEPASSESHPDRGRRVARGHLVCGQRLICADTRRPRDGRPPPGDC